VFLDMLDVFAEFETNLRRERQIEGIKAAKDRCIYQGRKSTIDPIELRRLREGEARACCHRTSPWHRPCQRLPSTRNA